MSNGNPGHDARNAANGTTAVVPDSCCDYKTLVAVFKALSDESRQKILLSLEETGETRVSELVRRFGVSQPTMSHHLGVLRKAKLVEDRRVGQSIYYAVNRKWLQKCCNDYLSRFRIEEDQEGWMDNSDSANNTADN